MSHVHEEPQTYFDPHYEWQGEHYEWQGSTVHSIKESINPSPNSGCPSHAYEQHSPPYISDRLRAWGNAFAALVFFTPGMLAAIGALCFADPHSALLLGWVFYGLIAACGLGGLVFVVLGCKTKSWRFGGQGIFGLFAFAAFVFLLATLQSGMEV